MSTETTFRPAFFTRALKHHWVVATVIFAAAALVSIGALIATNPTYTSTSIVFLDPLAGNPYSPTTPTSRTEQLAALTTEAGLVYTDAVVSSAVKLAKTQGVALGPDLRPDIYTSVPSNSQVVQINFSQSSPKLAQSGAQALAESYLTYRHDRAVRVVDAQTELRAQQLTSITKLLTDASTRFDNARASNADQAEVVDLGQQVTLYANQLAQVKLTQTAAEATSISPGDIISPAVLPTSPEGFNPLLISGAILFIGLAFGLMAALARENLDQRVRDANDVAAAGIPSVQGTISRLRFRGTVLPDAEGYRRLGNVLMANASNSKHVRLLAGAPGGTSTWPVAVGLANALNEASVPVVLLATEALDSKEGRGGPGLTDVLAQKMPAREMWNLVTSSGSHSVLPVGSEPARLVELAQSPYLSEVLDELGAVMQVVVAGPSLDTGLGAALARGADHVLLVVDGKKATVNDLVSATTLASQIRVELTGAILLEKPRWIARMPNDVVEKAPAGDSGVKHSTEGRADAELARVEP